MTDNIKDEPINLNFKPAHETLMINSPNNADEYCLYSEKV